MSLLFSVRAWAIGAGKTEIDIFSFGQRLTLPSKALDEEREILVHLPRDYAESQQRYPLLFILDGDTHFDYASSVVDFLARNGRTPGLIVVAVPNLGKRDDMSPPGPLDRRTRKDRMGRGDKFLSFLADELMPWLDARYRTQPFRILSGHSRGGLFNLYALLERPDAFQAHIAVSPAWWWDDRAVVKRAKETLDRRLAGTGNHWLYISWGDDEPTIRDAGQELVDWMHDQELAGLEWKARYYPGDNHGTTPLRTLYDGLEWVFAGWEIKPIWRLRYAEKEYAEMRHRIRDHYAGLSRRYGYPVEPDPGVSVKLSEWLMENERYEEALAETRANLAAHPQATWLHKYISRILEKQGRIVEAVAEYQLALRDAENVSEADELRLKQLKRKAAGQDKVRDGPSSEHPPTH